MNFTNPTIKDAMFLFLFLKKKMQC